MMKMVSNVRSSLSSRMSLLRGCLSLRSGIKFGQYGLRPPRKLRNGSGKSIRHSARRQVQAGSLCSREKEIWRRTSWRSSMASSFTTVSPLASGQPSACFEFWAGRPARRSATCCGGKGSLVSNRRETGFLPAGIVSDPAESATRIIAREPPSDSTRPTIYVYGLRETTIEQINNTTGTVTYLHHDQAGSTRLLTGSTGTATGKCSYSAYGTPTCEGSATTPLGYDGQYTSTDTGLIYMRARVYDPTTAQFLSVDPMVGQTHAPYNYAEDNPLDEADPTGLGNWLNLGLPSPGEVAETLNPIKYYEEEIESYENGCGYFASVAHGLEGAVVGALDASGAGEEELGVEAADQGIAGVIKGYTQHGLEQAIERDAGRGVSPSAILDAVRSPLSETVQDDGATRYVGQNAVVIVSEDGRVVTTWPTTSAG